MAEEARNQATRLARTSFMPAEREQQFESEDFHALHADSQRRRRHNREASANVLRSKSIPFQSRNSGAHLIVEYGGETVDYWPGTGKWIRRLYPSSPQSGRGVFNLLKALGIN